MSALSNVPLNLAVPAAVASLAYLNAKLSFSYDISLMSSLAKVAFNIRRAEWQDRVNLFYNLEAHALAARTANLTFIVFEGRSWTYYEAYQSTLRYGAWLKREHGVRPKEIVAMDFMNSSDFIFMWLGLWSIGAVPAFINYNLVGKPLTHSVKASTARLLFVDEALQSSFPPEQLETFASPDFRDGSGPVEVVFYNKNLESRILQTEPVREPDSSRTGAVPRDMSILIYTSGTTGLPKPAIVSWQKCWAGATFVSNWLGLTKKDRFFTCMPLYHSSAALLGFITILISGTTIIISHKFSARNFWKEVREQDATVIQYVGETMRYLLANPPEIDPVTGEDLDKKNNVRMAFGNGLRPDIWNDVKDRFDIGTIAEFYAATEGTSGSWNRSRNDFAAGAVGRNGVIAGLVLGRSIAIVELDHETEVPWRDPKTGLCKAVPRGDPGELLYALNAADIAQNFQGYFNNDQATESKVLRDVITKGDAWFRTGDVIRWDSEGRWYFSDRIGDTFRWKSENVSTNEVAEVLGVHPEIHEANVYGVALPHHDGRAGCATIVLKNNLSTGGQVSEPPASTLESIATASLKNLPKFAVPLFVRVTGEMQATGNNKQQKHQLRVQGVDPDLVAKDGNDLLYWLKGKTYVPFGKSEWEDIGRGKVKL